MTGTISRWIINTMDEAVASLWTEFYMGLRSCGNHCHYPSTAVLKGRSADFVERKEGNVHIIFLLATHLSPRMCPAHVLISQIVPEYQFGMNPPFYLETDLSES